MNEAPPVDYGAEPNTLLATLQAREITRLANLWVAWERDRRKGDRLETRRTAMKPQNDRAAKAMAGMHFGLKTANPPMRRELKREVRRAVRREGAIVLRLAGPQNQKAATR